ncbi:MAG: undecaprenyl/decaprenyl-phosphate alpha-N-acetylglucosaminyl 1-phosphate transferase [Marinibacterium sp.]|nr:undecaprenyl/decaprenyl-phosphate alpha-N-acetylglucosaminyl 1-phosphate transferase [Marinibacterium sp.]
MLLSTSFAACSSYLAVIILLALSKKFPVLSGLSDELGAVQSSHVHPAPRTGGISIAVGLVLGAAIATYIGGPPAFTFVLLLIVALPVFVAGIFEDLFRHVPSNLRFLSAVLSAILAVCILQAWISEARIGPLDQLVQFSSIGILLTVFVTASFSHAFNLIDGLNGLSSGTGFIVAVALFFVGSVASVPEASILSALVAGALLGFIPFNWPFGRIFLGDAGAYLIGFLLAWGGVLLIDRSSEVSGWAVLLIFFWPMADTLFAMYRRLSNGRRFDLPDRLHYHQLVMRVTEITFLGRRKRELSNPLATVVLLPLISAPAIAGVICWNDSRTAFLALMTFSVLFVLSYVAMMKLATRHRSLLSALGFNP